MWSNHVHQTVVSTIAEYQVTGIVKDRKRAGRQKTVMPACTRF